MTGTFIDLRSDTCTRPTDAMRRAMADASVGDDIYGDDPSVAALEARVAELLGKERAVFMPSGTMTNQVALRAHCASGDGVLIEKDAHIAILEAGGAASLSGLTTVPLCGERGILSAAQIHAALARPHGYMPPHVQVPLRLLALENTHNLSGGSVWPLDALHDVCAAAREYALACHLDGARLWNAAIAQGVAEAEIAAPFDSVSVCLSKGLGAPVGSALAGSRAFVARARRFRQMYGGGMRQAGIIAAGALYALDHHRARLADDHANAQALAEGLTRLDGVDLAPGGVETNIVRFSLRAMAAGEFVERLRARGIGMLATSVAGVRAVTHLDVDARGIEAALDGIRSVLTRAAA